MDKIPAMANVDYASKREVSKSCTNFKIYSYAKRSLGDGNIET